MGFPYRMPPPPGEVPGTASYEARGGDWGWLEDLLSGGGGGGGGGGGYRPQTAEEARLLGAQADWYGAQTGGMPGVWGAEADWLAAQTAGMPELWGAQADLYGAQAADIPLARELERRKTLAEIGVQQAERAANPRRIFEALYSQARLKPTEMATGLQEKMNIPGFKKGTVVEGPALSRVGKHDDEYALLAPGSVVAPKPGSEPATVGNAISAILHQMREGGAVSQAKAKKIRKHGEVRGEALTERQKGLFGLIAGGGTPTRLHKAQGGLRTGRLGRPAGVGPVSTLPQVIGRSVRPGGPGAGLRPFINDLAEQPRRVTSGETPGYRPLSAGGETWPEEFGIPPEVAGEFEELFEQGAETVLGATEQATGGTSLFDPMGGSRFKPGQADFLRGLNIRDFNKMSPTQQQAVFSMLSAGGVEPGDFAESLKRQFRGLNPVAAGSRARFSGMLGR